MRRVTIANLKGPRGVRGLRGLPGAADVPTDPAVAEIVATEGSETQSAVRSIAPATRSVAASAQLALYAIGDSLTHAQGSSDPWMHYACEILSWDYYNDGWSGQRPDQIAARQGGQPARLTFPGDTIPASGTVGVTADVNPVTGSFWNAARAGVVAGVHGMLMYTGTELRFTRDDAGSPVALAGPAPFLFDAGQAYRDWVTVIWAGRNGLDDTTNLAAIRAMVRYLGAAASRFLILQVPNAEGWPDKTELNHSIASEWPENYAPVADWLRSESAAAAVGIAFTAEDLGDIAAGWVPRSFRSDEVHHNATGRHAIGIYVAQLGITVNTNIRQMY